MLAGLLFATADASDRHDTLAATLPIGGVTLIEFQARLLIAAGASQMVVVVSRLTPELLGAVNRMGRRGVAVDTVRGPAEAIAKLHPLARVIWLADGLVTTGGVVEAMRDREGDTLLVSPEAEGLERIGPGVMWAGVATIDPQRIADVAKLPSDYDFASSLLRVVAQRGAAQLALPEAAVRDGHGIQRDLQALVTKGRAALIAALGKRTNWVDRFLIAPLAKIALPPLVARGVPALMLAATGIVAGIGGLAALVLGWPAPGLAVVVAAVALFALADVLAWLRDERRLIATVRWAIPVTVGAATLLLGRKTGLDAGTATAPLLALGAVVAGALAERAAGSAQRQLWWATPAAYPLILLPAAIAGQPLIGLAAVAGYAVATLAHAIERLRSRIGT
ncbi:hypothetical protein FPZ24_06735 [Sphingomonas panacisoli]|uniref:Uncharacterized protein n=1 Tax=Sphingomonas panacisoli TaxID=1813879 RepID=A0A5B8LGG9_9SPHN|nr:hypothetical protein [Sphingomonas panacisoli]QDZ07211.1 hypothetical protein FPZ24_06735 [Sphingomonas panacisoli]